MSLFWRGADRRIRPYAIAYLCRFNVAGKDLKLLSRAEVKSAAAASHVCRNYLVRQLLTAILNSYDWPQRENDGSALSVIAETKLS